LSGHWSRPGTPNLPQEFYSELVSRLAQLRRRQEHAALASGFANGFTSVLVLALGAIAAEALGHFSIEGRTWLFWSALVLSIVAFLGFIIPPALVRIGIRGRASDDDLARRIGRHYPDVNDRLVNSLQLARPLFSKSAEFLGSPGFALAAFSNTYHSVREIDFLKIVDDRPAKRSALLFFLTLALGVAAFLGSKDEMLAATSRLVHFRTFYQKPAPFTFVVEPGNIRVMRGDSVRVIVFTRGEQLPEITLRTRDEGQKEFDAVTLNSVALDSATASRNHVKSGFIYSLHAEQPAEYYVQAGDIESDRYKVTVLDHPIVRSLLVEVDPPAYTRAKHIALPENIGDLSGVAGTRGVFRVIASKPLAKANIIFTSTDTTGHRPDTARTSYSLLVNDSIATGTVMFLQSGTYHIALTDRDSVKSEHPIEYSVSITKDMPPEIVLLEPTDRADLPNNLRLDMLAHIRDDYGFRGVRLGYRISKSKYLKVDSNYTWATVPIPNPNAQEEDVPYIWNLTPLSIGPEDEVSYVMEVTDNDAVTGPKSARTPEYTVRVPSVEEIFKKADEQASKAEQDMNEIKQDAEALEKKVTEAAAEMQQMKSSDLAKQSQDFSKQKDVQQMLDRQNQLNDRLDQVAKDLQQMTQSLDQQQALSPETVKAYQELQELFKQIDSPELKKAMEALQQAMQKNVDPKKLEEAMQNMKLNEEQFRKSIERTENILKKIQAEQKVDELMKSADELAKEEQKSSDAAHEKMDKGQSMTPDEKAAEARKQEDAQKELDRMREEMKAVAQDMEKLPQNMQAPEETKQAAEALADPSLDQEMEQSAQAAQQGNMQQGAQQSEAAAKNMKDAERKLAELKRRMSESQRQETMREMRQIQDELNRLSKAEEQLKNQAKNAPPNSSVFRQMADQQSEKKDELGQTASKAMELAQKSTEITPEMGREMGKAFAEMQQAEDAMTDRNQQGSQQNAQSAMTSLNKASSAFQQALQKLAQNGQQGSNGSGGQGEDGNDGSGSTGENGDMPGSSGQPGGGGALQQFINQINQLAQQQQQLNDQMQGMMAGKSGGGQAAEKEMMREQAMMNRLAAQQQAVKKSLDQMADEQRQAQTGIHQSADELKKIADEMQQSIGDMRSSGVTPETIQRQERILSRLLQAERSVHERDQDQDRESKPGVDVVRESPRALDISSPEAQKELQQEVTNARETGYTADYNALIRKYFEELEKQ